MRTTLVKADVLKEPHKRPSIPGISTKAVRIPHETEKDFFIYQFVRMNKRKYLLTNCRPTLDKLVLVCWHNTLLFLTPPFLSFQSCGNVCHCVASETQTGVWHLVALQKFRGKWLYLNIDWLNIFDIRAWKKLLNPSSMGLQRKETKM